MKWLLLLLLIPALAWAHPHGRGHHHGRHYCMTETLVAPSYFGYMYDSGGTYQIFHPSAGLLFNGAEESRGIYHFIINSSAAFSGKVIDKVEFLQTLSPTDPQGGSGTMDVRYLMIGGVAYDLPAADGSTITSEEFNAGTEAAANSYTLPITDNLWIDLGAIGVGLLQAAADSSADYGVRINVQKANEGNSYLYLDGPYEGDSFDTDIVLRVTWHDRPPVRRKWHFKVAE